MTAWHQSWRDLLFAHWPVPAAALRPLVPEGLELEECEGSAWLGVVPFWMTIRKRGLPPLPGLWRFGELNVRTYVRLGTRSGVWFFSLDAANRPAVWAARRFFHLPYHFAHIQTQRSGAAIQYACRRVAQPEVQFRGEYGPAGPIETSAPGSLAEFLTERYSLFAQDSRGRLFRGDVRHPRWPLQPAWATIDVNRMAEPLGVALAGEPVLHFASRIDVAVDGLRPA